jgi:pyrimidine operon attenuation protein/uracil phosphoribosyltransferase
LNTFVLDAEALYLDLIAGVRGLMRPGTVLVGIWSGGAWLAERLQADLQAPPSHGAALAGPPGVICSALHRDDFGERGLSSTITPTSLPFEVAGAHIILIDDVLYTGRTIRAAINELFDYGRPASVALAVLVDRGGRQLPVAPTYAAARLSLPASKRLSLARGPDNSLRFSIEDV